MMTNAMNAKILLLSSFCFVTLLFEEEVVGSNLTEVAWAHWAAVCAQYWLAGFTDGALRPEVLE